MLSVINKFDATKVELLEEKITIQQERYLELMTQNVKLQDKASDAYVLAKESSAISKSTQREMEANISSLKSEVETELEALTEKMNALKKATTNPLGR
jgi:hypothetical protein